jgi:hypothetical protein
MTIRKHKKKLNIESESTSIKEIDDEDNLELYCTPSELTDRNNFLYTISISNINLFVSIYNSLRVNEVNHEYSINFTKFLFTWSLPYDIKVTDVIDEFCIYIKNMNYKDTLLTLKNEYRYR